MYRRALIAVLTGFLSISLTALAQDTNSAQTQSGSNAATPNTTGTQAQPTNSKTVTQAPPQHSSSKKHKKGKKNVNPIADVDSKQPDKVLFDRAMDAMQHSKYDVARLSLQTLINTYPDSEYVARAKLAIGDSWYNEGGAAAYEQAESEYKDFITFFPNMPEAAEAQMKIANIHFKEMEKADRDPTHALRAQDEYRQMILQFPDSPLVPQAKERLLEVQEVLARREYLIGHFYFLRDAYPAAIARLKSVTDTYPLFSQSDDALFELGTAYEKEIELIRNTKLPESVKGALIKQYTQGAIEAYDRILTRYPLEGRVPDAKKRLADLKQPIPKATPQAVAEDKKEIESRGSLGTVGKVMENFHRGPDISEAAKVGEPTLVDPKQSSAPDMVRAADDTMKTALGLGGGGNTVTVEKIGDGKTPPENAPIPHSDATPDATPAAGVPSAAGTTANDAAPSAPDAASEMKNDLPAAANSGPAPPPPPTQVNELAGTTSGGTQTPSASAANSQEAPAANPDTESSSKKKKKHHLIPF